MYTADFGGEGVGRFSISKKIDFMSQSPFCIDEIYTKTLLNEKRAADVSRFRQII